MSESKMATLAGGCFWCTEAIFKELRGVSKVVSGFSGGETENPTYESIHSGGKDHAESIQITFNPKVISYETLLRIFWRVHDPTTLNRQGADSGPEYRSAIFYHDENQEKVAEKTKKEVEKEGIYENPIVTEINPYKNFYEATKDHQEYYLKNKGNVYCTLVIDPKLEKFRKEYKKRLK